MKNFSILLPAFILFIMQISAVSAQDSETESESQESNVNLDFGTQIVSRNIWRGSDYGAAPAFVPEIALEAKGIQIGAFGALSTLGTYSEIDLFAAYNYKGFTMMFVDYFFPVENIAKNHYFEYRNKYTSHVFEIAFQYERTNRSIVVAIPSYSFALIHDSRTNFHSPPDSSRGVLLPSSLRRRGGRRYRYLHRTRRSKPRSSS